ncbi:acyl-CoA synthetase [Desulfolithobacter dissulfuricans]|uniref:Acyl-CoA synthetase n=1 Tax=Desulfolithobacter dissulfuricans TaxID=2795293 RepID=A0A915UA60_9BACT|nr:acetate--CoA ligase [Desulfolithobacter dissulfuricans]BCO09185.1 acyl-CoA synthetase [Desulfolithobacter dissulfuricans]
MTLEKLFAPGSVAVIGASRTPGKVGYDILKNLVESGFGGPIVPVNPAGGEILGQKVYKRLADYDQTVDLVVIVLPSQLVLEAAREAVAKGAGGVVVISAGFKEVGDEGRKREKELADIVRRGGARMLGPNCLGLINTATHLNASFAGRMPEPGSIAVFSQSGALCTAMLDMAAQRHLGLSKLVSIGNKADITEVDLLRALADDEDTSVIVGYLEDISSGDHFVKAAERACLKKPVILLKSGTTAAGRKAAASHTGVLAGAETAYGAAFKRSGVCRADTFDALFDYATALDMQPLPRGKRVLIITNAGGPGTMAADAVEKIGLEVAVLDRNTTTALRARLPASASVGNPVDVLGDADPDRYVAALEAAQEDESVDAILVLLTPQAMTKPVETARAIAASLDGSKPVLASFMGGKDVLPGRQELAAAGLPDYESPERAVSALKAMYDYNVWRRRPPRQVTRYPVNRRRVERIISRRQRTGQLQLSEVKSKDILKAYGFHIMDGSLAGSVNEAIEIARFIGFPVAMKIVSPNIIHKTDLGGVRLGLSSAQEVEDAYDLMMLRISKQVPDAVIEGVYVEKMADPGLEVIIGMTRDPQFGPMLMFGLGGIFVEVMKDVTFHLAPITREEAVQMLKSTRSYEMLKGKRGRKEVDIDAIAGSLQRISQLTTDFPQIIELDINPLIVGEIGTVPTAADARMTLAPAKNIPSPR